MGDDLNQYTPGNFDKFKSEDNIDHWFDFPSVMLGLGFKMDCGHSFEEYKQSSSLELKPAKTQREKRRNELYLLEHADTQIVGNYLLSQWRYFTHWAQGYNKYDLDFLRRIIAILEMKLTKE